MTNVVYATKRIENKNESKKLILTTEMDLIDVHSEFKTLIFYRNLFSFVLYPAKVVPIT